VTNATCTLDRCNHTQWSRGWCRSHYERWRRTGNPLGPQHPDLPGERWHPIPDFEDSYSVSDRGRVRSEPRTVYTIDGRTYRYTRRVLRLSTTQEGRHMVTLCRDGQNYNRFVHRLVAAAFIGPCPPGLEVCHNDGDCSNDTPGNLRYDTTSENVLDSVRHGTHPQTRRTHCPRNHQLIAPNLVPSVLRKGGRSCLACHNARGNVHVAKRAGRPYDFVAFADAQYARIMATA
jgi:hypothetical protein